VELQRDCLRSSRAAIALAIPKLGLFYLLYPSARQGSPCYKFLFTKFLHLIKVEVHVFIRLENIGSRCQKIIKEIGQEKCSSLVLLSRKIHLVLELQIIILERFILILGVGQLLLDLLKLLLEVVDQIIVLFRFIERAVSLFAWASHGCSESFQVGNSGHLPASTTCNQVLLFSFKILNLLFQALNDLLAEMRALSELFFNFLVDLDVSLQGLNLRLHLVVLE